MKTLRIALVSHIIKEANLGCGALAISNIRLLDQVLDRLNIDIEYVIATTDNLEQIPLESFTKHKYEYRIYPRCKQSLKNPLRLINCKVFRDCDLAINLCGGDGYTDIYGFRRLLAESQLVWVAKKNRVPMVYAPQTIGPFETKQGKLVAKLTLDRVWQVFVRDHASNQCCKELGLKSKITEVIDVAFALPFEKRNFNSSKMKIGFNVSGLLYNGGYNRNNYFGLSFDYKEFVDRLLARLVGDERFEVHLFPHVNTDANPVDDDYSVCAMLAEKYGRNVAPRYDSPVDAKGYIAGMDLFTGARMHSTIGAISSGVPVIPVAYSRKFNGLYGSLEYPWLIDAKAKVTVDEAIALFFDYLAHYNEMVQSVQKAKQIYTSKLEQYKDYLEEIIKHL